MKPADIALLHSLGAPTLTPDGESAVVSVTRPDLASDEYRGQLWIVTTDGSAPPRPFTTGRCDTSPTFSPDGTWLAFLRALGGEGPGAKPQLSVMPTDGGEPRLVSELPLGAGNPVWSPDGRRIAFSARVPDEGRYSGKSETEPPRRITTLQYRADNLGFYLDRRSHIFVVDPFGDADTKPIQISSGDFDHAAVTWSPDGTSLAFVSARHEGRDSDIVSDIWVCAIDGSHLRSITRGDHPAGPRLSIDQARFTPDGTSVCFAAIELGADGARVNGRNAGAWIVPADGSAAPRRLTDAETIHLVRDATIETTADGVLACAEHHGTVELLLIPYDAAEPERLLCGRRQIESFASAKSSLVAVAADGSSSGELIMLAEGTERQLTTFAAITSPRPLEEISTTAPDGHQVHGWVVRPEGTGPHPVLLMIHGGPFTQYGWQLFDEAQVYAGAGYAVIMGNPRGSSGYGQEHGSCIVGDAATKATVDVLALLDAGLATGDLDGSRVGVLGGSYGGYLTTWLAAHHGERFKAAISERAVNAVDSLHGSSDIGWFFVAALYGHDPGTWPAQSPLSYADQINIPMLIIHSEHDWRCPLEQAHASSSPSNCAARRPKCCFSLAKDTSCRALGGQATG